MGFHHGRGLVDKIYGLVRKKAVGDIAMRKFGGRHDGIVLDAHPVVAVEPFLDAAQDGNGVGDAWLVHMHGLKAPLQGRVLFDVLLVFVQGGGADAMQFTASQFGLEQIAHVHRTFGLAGSDYIVDFIDEEQGVSLVFLQFVQYRLEPLLEFAAVFGPGDKAAHVEAVNLLPLQGFGHVSPHDALGQAFDNGRFPHARLSHQHGIVFGFTRENPDYAPDFLLAPDNGVELPFAGLGHQFGTVFFQDAVFVLGIGAMRRAWPPTFSRLSIFHDGFLQFCGLYLVFREYGLQVEHFRLFRQGQEHVLDRDEAVPHIGGDFFGAAQHPMQIGRDQILRLVFLGLGKLGHRAFQIRG